MWLIVFYIEKMIRLMEGPKLSVGLLPVLPGFSDFYFCKVFVCHPFKTKCEV